MKTLRLIGFLSFLFCSSMIMAQTNVLIIYDDSPSNTNTLALKSALESAGYNVTISSVNESSWNNTNPALTGFGVVIHLNGTSYSTQMPTAGQQALVDFVENDGGLYVQFEWNAYQYDQLGQMQDMEDLILFQRTSGSTATITLTEVSAQSAHPVLASVPSSFSISGGYNVGTIRSFSQDPSTVLMKESTNDAVAIREFGEGCVLGFHNAGNYSSANILSDTNIHHLIIDFIGYCGFCGVTLTSEDSSVSCYGYNDGYAGIVATGGSGVYTYEWNTGATTSSISNLAAGTYVVTVEESGGCVTTKQVVVGSPIAINTDVVVNNFVTCYGLANGNAVVNVTGGTPPFTYAWSNGELTANATALPAGEVVIVVTDSNGCTFPDTVEIAQPTQIQTTYDITNVDCDGDEDGSLYATTSGGVPPYDYQWSNGGNYYLLNNLTNGLYIVTITDNVDCEVVDSVVVAPNFNSPTVDLGPDRSFCIDWPIVIDAGNAGASFLWSNGSPGQSITVSAAGTYWVEVSNEHDCATRDTIEVTQRTCVGIEEMTDASYVQIYPNPSHGFVQVSSSVELEDVDLRIMDAAGQLVISEQRLNKLNGQPQQVDLSQVAKGTYLLILHSDVHHSMHTLVIQ